MMDQHRHFDTKMVYIQRLLLASSLDRNTMSWLCIFAVVY